MRAFRRWSLVVIVVLGLAVDAAMAQSTGPGIPGALDLDAATYPRHETWGIFLGTGWSSADLGQIAVWQREGRWLNPFTGQPFANAPVFVFGQDHAALEGLRVFTDHLEVPFLSGSDQLRGHRFDFVLCHSNGCAKAIAAQMDGTIKVKHIFAIGADWTTKDFRPGELKGAKLTFFVNRGDVVPKLPAPSWTPIGEGTPGVGFVVPFDHPAEILRGVLGLLTGQRADPDRFDVIVLAPPAGRGGSTAMPLAAHALVDAYLPAIRVWMGAAGPVQRALSREIDAAGAGAPRITPPSVSAPRTPGPRGGVSIDIPIGPHDFSTR